MIAINNKGTINMKLSNILLLLPLLTLTACGDDDDKTNTVDTAACGEEDTSSVDTAVTVTCTDATGVHEVGATWTCEDGCNTCSCQEDGTIVQTEMACGDTGDTGGGDTGGEVPPDTGSADTGTDTSTEG
jgi:hypothetical protein